MVWIIFLVFVLFIPPPPPLIASHRKKKKREMICYWTKTDTDTVLGTKQTNKKA